MEMKQLFVRRSEDRERSFQAEMQVIILAERSAHHPSHPLQPRAAQSFVLGASGHSSRQVAAPMATAPAAGIRATAPPYTTQSFVVPMTMSSSVGEAPSASSGGYACDSHSPPSGMQRPDDAIVPLPSFGKSSSSKPGLTRTGGGPPGDDSSSSSSSSSSSDRRRNKKHNKAKKKNKKTKTKKK